MERASTSSTGTASVSAVTAGTKEHVTTTKQIPPQPQLGTFPLGDASSSHPPCRLQRLKQRLQNNRFPQCQL